MNTTIDNENIIEGKLADIANGSQSEDEVAHCLVAYMQQNDLKKITINAPNDLEEFLETKVRMTLADDESNITIELLE